MLKALHYLCFNTIYSNGCHSWFNMTVKNILHASLLIKLNLMNHGFAFCFRSNVLWVINGGPGADPKKTAGWPRADQGRALKADPDFRSRAFNHYWTITKFLYMYICNILKEGLQAVRKKRRRVCFTLQCVKRTPKADPSKPWGDPDEGTQNKLRSDAFRFFKRPRANTNPTWGSLLLSALVSGLWSYLCIWITELIMHYKKLPLILNTIFQLKLF